MFSAEQQAEVDEIRGRSEATTETIAKLARTIVVGGRPKLE